MIMSCSAVNQKINFEHVPNQMELQIINYGLSILLYHQINAMIIVIRIQDPIQNQIVVK